MGIRPIPSFSWGVTIVDQATTNPATTSLATIIVEVITMATTMDTTMATTMGTTTTTTTTTTVVTTTTTTVVTTITTTVEVVVAPLRLSGGITELRETVSHLTMERDDGVTPPDGTRGALTIIHYPSILTTLGPTRPVIISMENSN